MKLLKPLLAGLAALCLMGGPALAADNVAVTVGSGKTMACKDVSTVCYPEHMVTDSSGAIISPATSGAQTTAQTSLTSIDGKLTAPTLGASSAIVGDVGTATFGGAGTSCTTMTLPGTGGTYAGPASAIVNGDNVANNATAGSITNQTCALPRYAAGPFTLTGVRLKTSNTTITNGAFRIHFYHGTAPTFTNGNDGVLLTPGAGHFCAMDVTLGATSGGQVFSDSADGFGVPVAGTSCSRVLSSGTTIYWVLEARGPYAWTAAQTFDVFPQGFN